MPVILVVEDEDIIRMLAVDALEDAGFEVLQAGHAADAMIVLKKFASGIHALFTDVHMPGTMNGVMLAHEAQRCWPWIQLLIASGHMIPAPSDLPVRSRFLPKPYKLVHVVNHVRDMVARA